MWRPPEKIRHRPAPGLWPTRDEAARARLFAPLRYRALELAERTWVPAMVPWRAAEDGSVTDAVLDWYARFACGQPGAIVVEATGIRDVPSGPLLRIGDDRFLPGLEKIVQVIREASGGRTRALIQLIDFLTVRRRLPREVYLARFLRVTETHRLRLGMDGAEEAAVRERLLGLDEAALFDVLSDRERDDLDRGYRERVTDTDLPHIADLPARLPDLFARAAARAKHAGFDGVELHYAHAYTMASFLSARNTRADGYGGDLSGRLRLPLDVYAAVRAEVGSNFAVGARYLSEECIPGGNALAEGCEIGVTLARAGMEFLSLSRGGKFEDALQPKIGAEVYPYTGPSGYECMPSYISDARGPFGRNAIPAARIRQRLQADGFETPVVLAGGFHGFGQAEAALQEGQADIIAMARQLLADPDWPRKVRLGCGDEVRICEYTNYCEALDQKHAPVTCQLWDRIPVQNAARTQDGKRNMTAPPWSPEHR